MNPKNVLAYNYNSVAMGSAQGMGVANPAAPIPAQDPFGYTSGQPFPTAPGVNALISGYSVWGLPDPSTGARPGGVAYGIVPGLSPQSDYYQGISRNWSRDSMGYAPRIPTSPDYASSGRMGE